MACGAANSVFSRARVEVELGAKRLRDVHLKQHNAKVFRRSTMMAGRKPNGFMLYENRISHAILLALVAVGWQHPAVAVAAGDAADSRAADSRAAAGKPAEAPSPTRPSLRPTLNPVNTDSPKPVPRPTAKAKGEISFDDLVFDIEKGGRYEPSMLTEAVKALDGKKVKLRGFILPSTLFRETNIDEFVLVRDNQECCFGPGAALYDCVVVNLVDGVTTDFTTRPVTVTGTFKLKEYKYPDGSGHFAIFNLLGTDVR